jgi:quercetin dioxygenase-like cupin family protein
MNAATKQQQEHGIFIAHHFMYAKETRIPAGVRIDQHKHTFDHYSMLLKGICTVEVDGERQHYRAPTVITIAAGKAHSVFAHEDCEWWCLHETDERDVSKIDEALIEN